MKKLTVLFLFITIILSAQTKSNIILNEIMFNPQSGNNEFIEVYNLSETEAVDLEGYKIKYQTSNPDIIGSAGSGTILYPGSYAVIFEGDYDFVNGIYKNLIPVNALILKIGDNSFGTSGMANSSDRTIRILSPVDDTLETYIYTADNTAGISDEKINLNEVDSPENWRNSQEINGTPGYKNFSGPFKYDLTFSGISVSPSILFKNDEVTITSIIKNKGSETAESFSVEVYNDLNKDSTGSVSELIYQNNFLNLPPSDSIESIIQAGSFQEGEYSLIFKILFNQDENSGNNTKYFGFKVYPPENNFSDVVINEIMYAPSGGEPEWLEIYNKSASSINFKNWSISDATSSTKITENKFLSSQSYLVISKDSSITKYYSIPSEILISAFPSLNNSGDAVVIKDSLGLIIDSLEYFPSWGGNLNGRSLERISVNNGSNEDLNWGTSKSINKATPGKINSISKKEFDLSIESFKPEEAFGIIGEVSTFLLVVKNTGIKPISSFLIKIFRDTNKDSIPDNTELCYQLSGNILNPGDSSDYSINVNNFSVGKNFYIALVGTTNDDDMENNITFSEIDGVKINEVKNDIVINEIMFAPSAPEPEWFELYNRSNKIINLKNYFLTDEKDTLKLIENSRLINPGEFFVIADDSSFLDLYNVYGLQIVNFPSLNNSGDKIILLDSLSRVIDSLEYFSSWGGKNGRSLERINPDNPSADSLNWKTSKDKEHGTPGRINSVTKKDFDIYISEILFSPKFPQAGDNVNISAKIFNIGKNAASFKIEIYEDTNLDSLPDILVNASNSYNLSPGDSIIIPFNNIINNLHDNKGLFVRAVYKQDQDTSNNYLYNVIKPGYPESSIVINEIMCNPSGGEPEWIEIFNNTNSVININGWVISDVITTPASASLIGDHLLRPHSYLLIVRDSSIYNYHRNITSDIIKVNLPILNNDADGVVLKDDRNFTIDSLFYDKNWKGKAGYSFERISENAPSTLVSNWGHSNDIELSTPGRINSIKPKNFDLLVSELSFIPRFPIPGDNVYLNAKIKNNGSLPSSFSLNFYVDSDSDNAAEKVLSSESNLSLNSMDSINVTSSKPINNIRKNTLTAVTAEFEKDEDPLNNYIEKIIEPGFKQNTLVINEVMYSPSDNEPEWVELVNISEEIINLKNWLIGDLLPSASKCFLANTDNFLYPEEYLVVAHDSSFLDFRKSFKGKILFSNFGSLGTNDGIIIYDFREGIIDSLHYYSSWGGSKGYSIERISFYSMTNDSTNWSSSLSENKSTPGEENSFLNIPDYKRNDIIINEIMCDPETNNCEFVELFNPENTGINVAGWKMEDNEGNYNKVADVNFIINPGSYFVIAADSQIFRNYNLKDFSNIKILNATGLGLSKSGEVILIRDARGNLIDSVFYSEKWHNKNFNSTKNISLERINPLLDGNNSLNWSSSVNSLGATPGKVNSIYCDNQISEEKISVSPNPFSPDNDGFEDFTIINYNLSQKISQVRIKIFDNRGRLLRTLLNNQPSGSKGSLVFDGLEDDGMPFRMGIYIIFLEALNENSGVVETLKTVVVVARKL